MTSYRKLVSVFERLESISSHNRIVKILSSFLKELKPEEVRAASYLCLGTIGPKYEDTDLGLGDKYSIRAIASAYDQDEDVVKKDYGNSGDLGDTVSNFSKKKNSALSMRDVFDGLVKIREAHGKGSQDRKISLLAELLGKASRQEAKYIMRIARGKLRLGFGEQFLLEALSDAFAAGQLRMIEEKYNIATDIGEMGESLAVKGMRGIRRMSIKLGRPVQVMLAKRVDTIEELNKKFPEEMAAEEKYDGERAQVHIDGSKITIFSRRLENITRQFPDIQVAIKKSVKADRIILDGELVAYRRGKFASFQELMQRRRKYEVDEYSQKVPACLFLFDILYLSGKNMMKRPFLERRDLLKKNVKTGKKVKIATTIITSDFQKVQDFFKQCIDKGLEGIIVKSTGEASAYQAGKRGFSWVKWKKEYAEGSRDTFDLVVIGRYYGKGRRKEAFGALLCAIYNKGKYESFTKVGSGFSDEQFDKIGKQLEEHEAKNQPSDVVIDKEMKPDQFIHPNVVIEVLGAEITKSPKHTAGRGNKKGYALRFPRFLRLRPDKGPEQATSLDEIKNMKR